MMHVSGDGGGNPVNKSDYDWPTNIGQDELNYHHQEMRRLGKMTKGWNIFLIKKK